MKSSIKKLFTLILILFFINSFALAKDYLKANVVVLDEFNSKESDIKNIKFKIDNEIKIENAVLIPDNSTVELEIMQFQKEKRWHKNGFIVAQILNYCCVDNPYKVDLKDEDIYLVLKRYVKPDKLEIAITTFELAATAVASCFVPGVDVAYFFIKGAILRKKNSNWFKAGVFNAYDNSIFWFIQKGKNIDLAQGDDAQIRTISKYRAYHTKEKIDFQKEKIILNQKEKEAKILIKQAKKQQAL